MSPQQLAQIEHIGFLMLPNFSMIAFSNAIEPLRMANYLSRKSLYRWSILSSDGQAISASNGLTVSPISLPDKPKQYDLLIICGGVGIREYVNDKVISIIRQFATAKTPLGAICTGTFALAKAGVLTGHRSCIHWENLSSIREEFPAIQFSSELFAIDGARLTCSGGIAPIDLMCALIRQKGGNGLAADVSEQLIVDRIRGQHDEQYIPLLARIGKGRESLIDAALAMEMHIENPLPLDYIAAEQGISLRHLERLFKRYLSSTPAQYYLDLRLRRARELLLQTNMSVMEVTVATGFLSSSHFSKSYRNHYGYPPSRERQQLLIPIPAI